MPRNDRASAARALLGLAAGCLAFVLALPAFAGPDIHGMVEPCTVAFVQDNLTTCEACSLEQADPAACSAKFGPLGYTRKCRTGPHAPPAEVWCLAPPPPKPDTAPKPFVILGAVALTATVLSSAFVLAKRHRRPAK